MAIEKKLICFKTQANFETRLAAGDILDYSIVFIKDTQKIWTHGVYFSSLKEVQDALAAKQEAFPEGEVGQVLTQTEDGIEWADPVVFVDKTDNEHLVTEWEISEEEIDIPSGGGGSSLPGGGEVGQVLTKTETGAEWKTPDASESIEELTEDDLDEIFGTE